ncbi:MAG: MBL fold metallo-hydrolase [Meiothermus sp.]|uniref:MBL fold metallo-hydrolase n=1 Tax=Meiothermus sp. TaxID=1955249 RepID=UPI0025FB1A09|nr:MBL fold metallo-hydrolase [Meiothermus sp.]MCS7193392.1 MBL fold metallo-hydrolase [Meiothermus sp.]MDW8090905.1 MBL fold metallo-hydrolase [Meiothermus sp.]
MIHVLDLQDRAPRVIAAFLLETREGPVLFETGPESRFSALLDGLNGLGYAASDVRHVFVTHIHLDHAGAAWRMAERGATIYVHPRGAPHLVDPTKLWASAKRIYGEQMEALWGQMGSVPEGQVRVLQDGEVVRLGEVEVRAVETPGHADHHHAYLVGEALIGGDVTGVRIGRGPVLPPCPPPEIHIERWCGSLAKVRALAPRKLYLTHFGGFEDVEAHLEALEARLLDWAGWIKERLRAGQARAQMVAEFEAYVAAALRAAGLGPSEIAEYEYADPAWMSVDGLVRYWNKHHPEEIVA